MKNLEGRLVVDYYPETVQNHKPSKNSLKLTYTLYNNLTNNVLKYASHNNLLGEMTLKWKSQLRFFSKSDQRHKRKV
jgi:hypothetical protein